MEKIGINNYIIYTYEIDYLKKIKGLYGFIYITTNKLNGKKYVGQKKVIKGNISKSYLGSGTALKRAIEKYGKENFERKIIDIAFNKIDLDYLENLYSKKFNVVNDNQWYNLCYGGGVAFIDHSNAPNKSDDRLNATNINYQGCLMKCIKYYSAANIIVEFQDKYKYQVHTAWSWFEKGRVKNVYFPTVYNVGIIGEKYPKNFIGKEKHLKEYSAWMTLLRRCYHDNMVKEYKMCEEWHLYENFYEWLHSQENFDKWLNNDKWIIDNDITNGEKIYSPSTTFLVSQKIDRLFNKNNSIRGDIPIGVVKNKKSYSARCKNENSKNIHLGTYDTSEEAFYAYKEYKENLIKRIAKEEYQNKNITKSCYEAMLKYEIKITD